MRTFDGKNLVCCQAGRLDYAQTPNAGAVKSERRGRRSSTVLLRPRRPDRAGCFKNNEAGHSQQAHADGRWAAATGQRKTSTPALIRRVLGDSRRVRSPLPPAAPISTSTRPPCAIASQRGARSLPARTVYLSPLAHASPLRRQTCAWFTLVWPSEGSLGAAHRHARCRGRA